LFINSVIKKIEIFLQRKYFNKKEEMSKFSESEIQFCNDIYWVLENSFDEKESIEITKTLTYKNGLWKITRKMLQTETRDEFAHTVSVQNLPEEKEFSNTCFVKEFPDVMCNNPTPDKFALSHNLKKYFIDKYSFYYMNLNKSL
jgi:hypothetical protein